MHFSSFLSAATLVQTLMQFGMQATQDMEFVREVLFYFGINESKPPTDKQVSNMLADLAQTAAQSGMCCDVRALVELLSTMVSL